ncbi:MAG: site-specific integrase [Oscillospiraceae bacterium]|nr:site-specific integrase [Oscillospiraceae bacterium]
MARRKAGDGLIRKRKDGRWEGRVVVGYDESGLPKTKNVLAKTKRECQEKLETLKASLGAPPTTEEKCSSVMPFGEWLDHWYRTYIRPNVRPGTRENYELRIYRHITPQLGKIPLGKLTQGDLLRFYGQLKRKGRLQFADKLGKGLSDKMLRTCHALIKAALQKAVDEKILRDNPAVGCKLPPQRAKEMQVLTPEEMQRFLIQAKYDGYYEIFLVALATGLRRGELLALQWDDLDLDTRELRVRRTVRRTEGRLLVSEPKTDAGFRTLLLPPSVVKVLVAYKETICSRWMFPSPVVEDAPRDPSTLAAKMKLVLARAGCKIVRFHDLRHTFATEALEHGMDVKTLSAIIGHVSAATTLNIYAHVTDTMQAQAAWKIDHGIAGRNAEAPQEGAKKAPLPPSDFTAARGRHRKPGTGCISRISETLWEGRYSPVWPDGKKRPRNIYAHSEAECEAELAAMIAEEKVKIAAERERMRAEA